MSTRQPDRGENPLVTRKTSDETEGEFVRFELTFHPGDEAVGKALGLEHEPWPIDFPTEHVHPQQSERWRVLSGGLGVAFEGREEILGPDDTVTLPAGVPHRVWNPLAEPSRVVLEFRPALDAQELTETLYVLAQRGETGKDGRLKPLQFAVTVAAYPDQLYPTGVPVTVQKKLARLLAPLGRRLGYRESYDLD
ncbi:cupin domain-containing protein [Natrononativus amylolyticus]|uniref:cupin domain-containing protein n=1 Tax=Natrononativus amylolyticus TaxID=2963434 RepID=UPI0020CFAA52|nr:cupin domain-containing protein [Natrononativus amylolyticus]